MLCKLLCAWCFLLVIGANYVQARDCSPTCEQLTKEQNQLTGQIKRLADIRQANIEFLETLDPASESKRIKASSNIRISESRIHQIQTEKEKLDKVTSVACGGCKEI